MCPSFWGACSGIGRDREHDLHDALELARNEFREYANLRQASPKGDVDGVL
jgi:ribosomal protein S14